MNEQERLQRVIGILADNADGMCYADSNDEIFLEIDMDGIQTVAKEISQLFNQELKDVVQIFEREMKKARQRIAESQQLHKDTRSRREKLLDAQFANIGVKPHVYHFTERVLLRGAFNAITIATIEPKHKSISTCIEKNTRLKMIEQATHLIEGFEKIDIYGIAICDTRDVFSKRYGRMKAKGRLMQHILRGKEE